MAIIRNTNITDISNLIFYLDAVNSKSYPGSGSTWYDLSGNSNHFTLYNTPTYIQNGTTGTYFTFNGTNQYACSANAINFNAYSAVTIEIAYRTTSTSTQILYETTGTGGSTATGGITLLMNANSTGTVGNIYLSQWQGYGTRLFGYTASTNTAFNSVVEQFVNAVDASGRQTYVNSTLTTYFTNTSVVSAATTTTSGLAFANTWTYIASRAGASNFFNGDIAYVKAYGVKISSTNIAINQNSVILRQPISYSGVSILSSDPSVGPPGIPPGGVQYVSTGTFSWTAPAGVTSVCVVCIGSGGGGNGTSQTAGNDSYFISTATVLGGGGQLQISGLDPITGTSPFLGGRYVGDGGGRGGRTGGTGSTSYPIGGGGAGGYTGNGGNGTDFNAGNMTAGLGGGGGGGGGNASNDGAGGGGVGVYGAGSSGAAGTFSGGAGGGGSGGTAGVSVSGSGGGDGGNYGGGGGSTTGYWYGGNGGGLGWKNYIPVVPGNSYTVVVGAQSTSDGPGFAGQGGKGTVRIIWGTGRAFPSTGTLTAISETLI